MLQANKYRSYSAENLALALSMVREGGMSKRKAAKLYGIPRTTLLDKLAGRAPDLAKSGPPTALTNAEEMTLVRYITLMAAIGYPLTKKSLLEEVKRVLDDEPARLTPFKNNLPGDSWYYAFMKRHPGVSLRTSAALGYDRAAIDEDKIKAWFEGLIKFLKTEWADQWEDLFKDPRRVWNADESGFPLHIMSGRVLAPKGSKHVYQITNSDKTQITCICSFSAMGNYAPPMIIMPGQRIRDVGIGDFPDAVYGVSESGWMTSELFVSYLQHIDQYMRNENIPRPVILFIDGHSTHLTLPAATFCRENDIILYCLLAHASHVLQPCDVSFFGPLKNAWTDEVTRWKMANLGQPLTKKHFPGVFHTAFNRVATLENAASGFRRCGLFPLQPSNVDHTKLGPGRAAIGNEPASRKRESMESSSNTTIVPHSSYIKKPKVVYLIKGTDHEDGVHQSSVLPVAAPNYHAVTPVSISGIAHRSIPSATVTCDAFLPIGLAAVPAASATGRAALALAPDTVPGSTATESVCSSAMTSFVTFDSSIPPGFEAVPAASPTVPAALAAAPDANIPRSNAAESVCSLPTVTNFSTSSKGCASVSYQMKAEKKQSYISPSFNKLRVPEPATKKRFNIQMRLPKAVSGNEAIRMLNEKEQKKIEEEEAKIRRKEERETNRLIREQEKLAKEKKRQERKEKLEEKRIQKEANRGTKIRRRAKSANKTSKNSQKRRTSSSSSDSGEDIPYIESDSEFSDTEYACAGCKSSHDEDKMIGCDLCPTWWHKECTNLAETELRVEDLETIEFICSLCQKVLV